MLADVLNELGSSLSVDDTLSLLAARLKRMIPYDTVAIYVRQEQRLIPQFVSGKEFRLFSSLEIPKGQGLSGWVAENRRPIVNGNPSVEPGYLNDPPSSAACGRPYRCRSKACPGCRPDPWRPCVDLRTRCWPAARPTI